MITCLIGEAVLTPSDGSFLRLASSLIFWRISCTILKRLWLCGRLSQLLRPNSAAEATGATAITDATHSAVVARHLFKSNVGFISNLGFGMNAALLSAPT